jgi:hypothetical protein
MKKEFFRNGVKFTMEIVDWSEFNKLIDKVDEFCNEETHDWTSYWYIRDQLLAEYEQSKIDTTGHDGTLSPEESWACEFCFERYLKEWDASGRKNDWNGYFETTAELADEKELRREEELEE